MNRICSKCKTENLEEANYCKECGTKLGKVCPSCYICGESENLEGLLGRQLCPKCLDEAKKNIERILGVVNE